MDTVKLCITNDGEIDENALFLLGASTKEGQNKIGFFGSGNKYAIATLLRLGVPFEVYSGEKEIEITTVGVDFRGEHFDQIRINGKETSFTTRMGPSWVLWYALREFYCNALDEGGASMEEVEEVSPVAGATTIAIECTEEVSEFLANKEQYFSGDTAPLWTAETEWGTVRVLEGDGKRRVFRKGICVYEENRPAQFWYDFDTLTINESRVAQYSYEYLQGIAAALIMAPTEEMVELCKGITDGDLENDVFYSYIVNTRVSEAWKEALTGVEIIKDSWVPHLPPEDVSMGIVLKDDFVNLLQKQAPELHFRDKCNEAFVEVEISDEALEMVGSVVDEVIALFGYQIEMTDFLFGRFTQEETMATYSIVDHKVRLSLDYLDDRDDLLSTIYEECILHKEHGLADGSRATEAYLMREYIKAMKQLAALKNGASKAMKQLAAVIN